MKKLNALLLTTFIAILSLFVAAPLVRALDNCTASNVRWASSSNTLYVSGSNAVCSPATLSSLQPTKMVNVGPATYLLRVNLKLTGGATLEVHGTSLAGGNTNELRLLSNNTSSSLSTVNITADVGNIDLQNTKVTSWDEAAQGPDTKYSTYKRSFIRVRSRVVNNQPQTSNMNIINSDVGYLGYYGAEAYGLSWKVMDGAFAAVDVTGNIVGSHIHHNYFGVYTFGAFGMKIDNNEFNSNVQYGLDPHDDSDSLTITNNSSHDNGNHGIICSQRCDHLLIQGNRSYNNIGHGIMLHRSTDYSTVEDNTVYSNSDSGIALFESNNNVVQNNHIDNNKNGIRLSVGSSYNQFSGNTLIGNNGNSIYTYQGSDTPQRPGNDGINRGNVWTGNIVQKSGGYIMKLSATDQDRFENNDFRSNPGVGFYLKGATNTVYINNQTDPGVSLP